MIGRRASREPRAHWWVLVLLAVTLAGTLGRWHGGSRTWGAAVLAGLAVLLLLWRERDPGLTWLGNAAAVRVGHAIGRGDPAAARASAGTAVALGSSWMGACGIVFLLVRRRRAERSIRGHAKRP